MPLRIGSEINTVDYFKCTSIYNSLRLLNSVNASNITAGRSLLNPKVLANLYNLLKSSNLKGQTLFRKALVFKVSRVEVTKSVALKFRRYRPNNNFLYNQADRSDSVANIFNYNDIANLNLSKHLNVGKKDSMLTNNIGFNSGKFKNYSYRSLARYDVSIRGTTYTNIRRETFRRLPFKKTYYKVRLKKVSNIDSYTNNYITYENIRTHNSLGSFILRYNYSSVLNKKALSLPKPTSTLKKLSFSFLKHHQLKKDIIMRKQRVNLYRYNSNLSSKILTNGFLGSIISLRGSWVDSQYDVLRDLSVQRIKFKPGYRRLWKESRSILADLLSKKYEFQHQFTKYLTKFYRKSNFYNLSYSDLKVSNVILHSKLLPDYKSIKLMYLNNMIFLNGLKVSNLDTITKAGDIIQLSISLWFYTFSKWLLVWSNSRSKKLRRLIYRKVNMAAMQNYRAKKQRSFHTPEWVHNSEHDLSDIKQYLEVDFFTLSTVVIYDSLLDDYYSNSLPNSNKQYIYKVYN